MRPRVALLLGDRSLNVSRMDGLACDGRLLVLGTLQVLLHQFGRHTDDVLALPVLDHVERLQGADDVTLSDAGHLAEEKVGGQGGLGDSGSKHAASTCVRACVPEVLDGQRPPEVSQDLQQDPGPVTPVAQLSQVRQGLLRRTDSTFQL